MFTRSKIYEIIYKEMENLLDKMVEDFPKNYYKKENNWILSGFDNSIISHMVFVSSFESKYGNMFEEIVRGITKLNFGEENVPNTIKGVGISDEEYNEYIKNFNKNGQFIISKFDKKKNDGILSQFRADHVAQGQGKNRTPSSLNQESLPNLLNKEFTYSNKIIEQPVDLLFFNPNDNRYKLFEIKAGGDLDSSNGPKNIEKMLKIYSSLGKVNSNLYFATLYHKNGEGNNWTGVVKKHISEEDSILINRDFWEMILGDVSFDEFKEIYKNAFIETGFNKTLTDLINNTANSN